MHALENRGGADPVWLSKLLGLIVSMKPYRALPIISLYATQTLWDSETHGQPVARVSSPINFFDANFELVFSSSLPCCWHCQSALLTPGTRRVLYATPPALGRRRVSELFVRAEEGPVNL